MIRRLTAIAQLAVPPLVTLAAGLAVWEVAARALHVAAYLLPPPSQIFAAARASSGALFTALITTGTTALAGFLATAFA